MSMIDELGTDETPSAKRQDEQEKEAAIDTAKEQVLALYESSQAEGYDKEAHRNAIASLADLDDEGVVQGVAKIKECVQAEGAARREAETAIDWLEEHTHPDRGFRLQTLSEIDPRLPKRLLWHKDDEHGGILVCGQLAILTGEGGVGKSRLALQWALQACGEKVGDTGISVSAGNVIYVTYEDLPAEVRRRAKRILTGEDSPDGEKEFPDGFFVLDMMDYPLFLQQVGAHESSTPVRCNEWKKIWKVIRAKNPSLVIIDPIAEAYRCAGYPVSGVRAFRAALCREAQEGEFGILMLAHSSKAARSKEADPFDSRQVAGSAAWTDAARGVLALRWTETNEPGTGKHQVHLRCTKANHAASRWTETLESERGGAWTQAESSTAQAGRKAHEAFDNGKSVDEEIKGLF